MSVIIRLQGLPWTASALDIRNFFTGLQIPPGGVHIIGGEKGDAFIAFSTDEDARQAMMKTFQSLNGSTVQLLLSSKTEMQNVIDAARTGQAPEAAPEPKVPPVEPVKTYDDPYYRGPPTQDIRSGYQEDYKYGGDLSAQGGFGNDQQQGYRDNYGNPPPNDPWQQQSGFQKRFSEESGFPPDNKPPFGGRDQQRNIPPRGPYDRDVPSRDAPPFDGPTRDGPPFDGPPRDGPPFDGRNQPMPNERFQEPFFPAPPDLQAGGPPMDMPRGGEPPFDRNQGPPFERSQGPPFRMNDTNQMDRRPPSDVRRPERGDIRRHEGRFSDGREGRDGRERDGRDSRDRDGRDSRDRRDRSDRDRDRGDRDRSRSDRSDRYDRSDRFDRSRRDGDRDRDRRDHSESRRDSREPRDSRDRPPFDEKPDQRNSPLSRPGREPPSRNSPLDPPRNVPEPFGPPGAMNRPDFPPGPEQFPLGDMRRRPDDFQGPGSFPPRDRGPGDRPKSRFDQEGPASRFGPDERGPPKFDQDPDYRSDPRGPPEGPRGRGGLPPRMPEQGNGFDRDNRRPDRDFRGGPGGPGEPGFPPRPQMAPKGRGRGMDGPPPGARPPGFHDENYPRGPNDFPPYPQDEGPPQNAPWDMDSRFPGGPTGPGGPSPGPRPGPGRPPISDFPEKRPGLGNGSKGLLGDAPAMFPPRGPIGPDMQMDHDGREPNPRHLMQDRPGPGPGGPGPFRDDFGGDDYEGRQRFRGRDPDQRRDDRGPRPPMGDHERRRPDWGPDGGRDGRWPPRRPMNRDPNEDPNAYPRDRPPMDRHPMDRPPRDRSMDRLPMDRPPRDRPPMDRPPRDRPPMDDQSRKRPRPQEPTLFIFVKNLPYTVSYSMIRRFFTGCDIPYDGLKLINNEQGKRNGTAYIRFMTEEASFNAIQRNGMDMNGRNIVVYPSTEADFMKAVDSYVPDEDDEDEPEPAKRPRSDDAGKATPITLPAPGDPMIMKIINLPLNVTMDEVKGLFAGINIAEKGTSVYMEYNSGGSFTGVACVELDTVDDFKKAIELEGKHMGSRILRVAKGSQSDLTKAKSSQPSANPTEQKNSEVEKGQGDESYPYVCIHLTGVPLNANFRELRDIVNGLEIAPRGIQICHDGAGNPVGEAFIEFTNQKDCKESLKRDKSVIGSDQVNIKPILKSDMIQKLRRARTMNTRPGGPPLGPRGPIGPMGPGGPMGPPPIRPGPGSDSLTNVKPIPPGVLKRQWVYLRCSNLPLQVTIRELLGFFNNYNPVPESIRLHYTGDGNPTGNAVVGFPTKEEASKAMEDLNGTMCRRNNVVIQPANS